MEQLLEILKLFGPTGLVTAGLVFIFVNGSRERLKLSDGLSTNSSETSKLASKQEDNAALSDKRRDEERKRYEDERQALSQRIDGFQTQLSESKAVSAYTNGALDTLKEVYAKDSDQWRKDRLEMKEEIDVLKRDVDALKKRNHHQDERIAEQIETITSLEAENKRLTGLLESEERKSAARLQELQEKIIQLKVAEKKRKDCEEQEQTPDNTGDKISQLPKQDKKASA